ncbi:MAG TPA: hypothetical protein DD379_13255 [Cyanobacteria bacterium UBA11162]|nr:hypothetical protein [Cyanobacteria bacterium UBA11162]
MKITSLPQIVGAGVLATSLSILPLAVPVHAQDTAPRTYVEPDGEVESVEAEDDFDWGWLGLLGLAGLAGLAGKKRHETVHTSYSEPINRDPDVVTSRGHDFR